MNKNKEINSSPIKAAINDNPSFDSKQAEHLALESATANKIISNNIEVNHLQATVQMLQQKVAIQQNLINTLTAITTIPICLVNSSGDIIECNPDSTSLFSIDTELLISTSIVDYISQPQTDKFNAWFLQLFSSSSSTSIDTFIKQSAGDSIAVQINAIVADEHSMPAARLFFIVKDTAVTAIQIESEAKYKTLIDQSFDGVLNYNLDGSLLEFNDKAHNYLGYTREEFMQLSLTGLFFTEDLLLKPINFSILKQGKTSIDFRRLKRKDGSGIEMELNSSKLPDGSVIVFARDITERKKAAAVLSAREKYFRTLIEYSSAAIILFEEDGTFIYQSPAIEKIVGYKVEEGVQSNLYSFLHPEDAPAFEEMKAHLLLHPGKTVSGEIRVRHNDGNYIWIGGSITNLLEQENLHAFIANYHDITESKMAAEKLLAERSLLRALIDNMPDPIYVKDTEGKKMIANKEDQLYMGVKSEDDIIGKTDLKLYPGNVGLAGHQYDMDVMGNGIPVYNKEVQFVDTSSKHHWLMISKIPLRDNTGGIIGLLGIGRDISTRKKAENELLISNERYQYVTKATFDAVWDWDIATNEVFRGEGFETLFGYDLKKLNGYIGEWDLLLHPHDFKRVTGSFNKAIKDGSINWNDEYQYRKANGDFAFVQDKAIIIRDDTGAAIRMVGAMQDVTEQKMEEEKIQLLNQALAEKAAALTDSNNDLEKFAYVASHDLQEPLRMVTGFLKLLENKYKSGLDETANKYIHYAVDGADRMKSLIKDLLEYSRVSTSKDLTGDTDMNKVVAEVLQVFALNITEQQANVTVGQLPVLSGSKTIRLFQLIQNLIGNALKYQGTAAPEISIKAIEKPDHWLFSVADNGIGIDIVYAEKIFIIFQRLHSKDEFSGTGIGLSICKKIVEMHGGKIWVAPNLPSGSIFYFTIRKTN